MAKQIPKYDVGTQSGITLAACILENVAHSACPQPESTPCEVGEDDPWSPLSFPNMSSFRDFIANAMWQQYQCGQWQLTYPDDVANDDDEDDGPCDDGPCEEMYMKEEPVTGRAIGVEDEVQSESKTAPLAGDTTTDAAGHGGTVNVPPTPAVHNANGAEPPSPPITFKVFIEQVFDFPRSQVPSAYTTNDNTSDTASEEALPSSPKPC